MDLRDVDLNLLPVLDAVLRHRSASLAARELDMSQSAIGSYPRMPQSMFQRRLFERGYVGLVRAGHPLARRAPTMRQFAHAQHVVVRAASGIQDRVDEQLAAHGLARRALLELSSYLMAPPLVEAGDFLLVLPEQLADAFAQHGRLAKVRLPIALPPSTIRMHWHRRTHEDPGNAWLRSVVAEALADR